MKKRYIVLFGLVYTIIYFYLAIDLAGAGHGTIVFFAPLFTWILLFIALFLLTKLNNLITRIFFVTIMLTHYIITLFFLRGYSFEYDEGMMKMWNIHSTFILFAVGWYLLGQLLIWILFLKAHTRKGELL